MQRSEKIIKQVVLTNLAKQTPSNPAKNFAEAMIDGTITERDLRIINSTEAFPANNFNRLNLPEGEYRSMDAMEDFVAHIGQHLSDAALYHVTHTLARIEVDGGNTQAYRTSTLAKYFAIYEANRHRKNKSLPAVFLSHMHEFVLPLAVNKWVNLESTLPTFIAFNLIKDAENTYADIINFPSLDFKAAELVKTAPASAAETAVTLERVKSAVSKPAPLPQPISPASPPKPEGVPVSAPHNFRLVRSYSISNPENFRAIRTPSATSTLFAAEHHRIKLSIEGKIVHLKAKDKEIDKLIENQIDQLQTLQSQQRNPDTANKSGDELAEEINKCKRALHGSLSKQQQLQTEINEKSALLNSLNGKLQQEETNKSAYKKS